MRTTLRSFIAFLAFTAITMFAFGTTYNVGPTRTHTSLQQIQSLLAPGDLVLIDGDATYPGGIYLGKAGTAANPITIKGVRINGNQPIISGGYYGVNIDKAHYNILEGLVFTASTKAALGVFADQVTIRDCVIRDNEKNGIIGYGTGTGSLLVEYCEFFNNGNSAIQPDAHQIYMATDEILYPNAVFRLQYCYIHHGKGGVNVNSRAGRNEIYYNWIEGAYYHELTLMGPDVADNPGTTDNTLREDGDVVGNVLINTTTFAIARLGSDGLGNGTFGRYRFVNNTIIMNGRGEVIRGNLGIGTIEMHNNVIYNTGNASDSRIFYDQETNWSNGRQVIGTNNWIQTGTSLVPAEFTGTISGTNPGFVNLATKDVNLLSTSPLINTANSAPPTISAYPFINPLFPPLIHPPFHTPQASPATPRPGVGLLDIGAYEYGSGPACSYALSPSSASVGMAAGSGSVNLTTLTGCAWATSINVPWLTLTSATSGTSSGTLNYSYTANSGGPRTGMITTGGQTFTVTQAGIPCTYSLSAPSASFSSAGGSGNLTVTAVANCEWSAVSSQPWIVSTSVGTGNGPVTYNVTANNTNTARTGTLTIGGQVFTITQAGATGTCTSVTAAGASDWANASITSQTTSFTAHFDATVSSSTINSAIGFSNGPQFSFTGFGCIMLFDTDGKIKGRDGGAYPASTVSYTAGVSYHFRVAVNVATHTYSIYVTAPGGSEQTVGTNYAFRTEQAGITQINNWAATVNYVSAGNMQVCNFTLGTPCTYTLSTAGATPPPSAGTGSFTVTTASTCTWTATSNASWLTVTSGATGTGNGTVNYSVALNNGASRTGTISVNGQTFTVTQSPAAGCSYSIATTSASVAQTATTGTIAVTATATCPWTAVSNNPWITITSGASGTGNGSAGYSVTNNVGPARSGSVLVAGQTFTINQAGSGTCVMMNAGGGWTNTAITSQSSTFTAQFDASTSNAQLDGLVGLSAGPQTAFAGFACIVSFSADGLIKARNGGAYTAASAISYSANVNYHFRLDINVATHTYSVYVTPEGGSETLVGANYAFRTEQAAITLINNWGALVNSASGSIVVCNFSINTLSCSYVISPANASVASTVTTGNITVTAESGCAWTAVSNAAWISITAGASGTGNGTVSYSVASNTGAARSGTITAAGQTFTINQAAGCTYAISPTSASAAATVTTGNITVTAGSGCAWTAVSNDSWISITAGASGTGNGTVSYSVAANTGAARSGTITAAGQTFTITQSAGCTYAISPTSASAAATVTTGNITVTAGSGCAWTSVSNDSWISLTAGASGTGNGTVSYSVAANTGAARSGTITAAGQTFTIAQAVGSGGGGSVDFYTDETTPAVSLVPGQASAAIVAEGVGGSNCVKFTGLNSYDKTYRIHYATPKDISGVLSTDKLRISVDMTPATPATTLGINLNGRWDLLIFTGTIDNVTGFQTFDVDISSVRTALGNTINDIYFQPGSGFPTNATLKVDNIKFVTAAPVCSYAIAPSTATAAATVTTGTVSVTAGAGCAWTAVSNDAWLTVTAGASGTGNGTVSYSAAANSGAARAGTITIGAQTFTLSQATSIVGGSEVDLYINETTPTISFITGTGQLGAGAAATVATGGVANSAYMEFTGLTSWDKSKRLHYSVGKDISGVASTAVLRISVDISTNTAGTGIGVHFNDKYNLVVYSSPADNTPGFQTFDIPISSIRAGLGNTVNDIYFEPSNGWTSGCVVKIDNVQLVAGPGSLMAAPNTVPSIKPAEAETRHIAVFPNPADNFVTVTLPSAAKRNTAVKLVDASGRIVRNELIQPGAVNLNVSTQTLGNGIYHLIIATEKGNVVKKIVVSH